MTCGLGRLRHLKNTCSGASRCALRSHYSHLPLLRVHLFLANVTPPLVEDRAPSPRLGTGPLAPAVRDPTSATITGVLYRQSFLLFTLFSSKYSPSSVRAAHPSPVEPPPPSSAWSAIHYFSGRIRLGPPVCRRGACASPRAITALSHHSRQMERRLP